MHSVAPRIAPDLVEAAARFAERSLNWRAPVAAAAKPMLDAARSILGLDYLLHASANRAEAGNAEDYSAMAANATSKWLEASERCVDQVLELAPRGLWPYQLWNAYDYRGRYIDAPCPACGTTPTLCRSYDAYPVIVREQWECLRCDLLADWPNVPNDPPRIALAVPSTLTGGSEASAEVTVDNELGTTMWAGAGGVVVDTQHHGVITIPKKFKLSLLPHGTLRFKVRLVATDPSPVAHVYRAKALLLLNGLWFLASRHILVTRSAGSSAATAEFR